MTESRRPWLSLLLFLTAGYVVGFAGSFPTNEGLSFWYLTLRRPEWGPPVWVFAPAWTVLYAVISVAAWMVFESEPAGGRRTRALLLFSAQLVLNGVWPWLFFRGHLLMASMVEMGVLLLVAVAMLASFFKARVTAGRLVVPYVLWLAYLAVLSVALSQMNR